MLDEAGFQNSVIVASNELDETIIESLNLQGAAITVWGVGTKLVTGQDQAALGGVYKLTAIIKNGAWQRKLKLSEQVIKVNNPGIINVRRFFDKDGLAVADAIYDIKEHKSGPWVIVDPLTPIHKRDIAATLRYEDILTPVLRNGKLVYDLPEITAIQAHTKQQLELFHPGIKRFVNPHTYPVGLESRLYNIKMELVKEERKKNLMGKEEG